MSNYEWREANGQPMPIDSASVPPACVYATVIDPSSHEAVARLLAATETLLDVVSSNRLLLGEYIGPTHLSRIERNAKEAIAGLRGSR